MMEAGASFIARTYSAKIDHLSSLIQQAVFHKGFSFIEVLQPCVSYNNTYELYNSRCVMMDEVPATDEVARVLAKDTDQIRLGIFKQVIGTEYCEAMGIQDNPMSRSQRLKLISGS